MLSYTLGLVYLILFMAFMHYAVDRYDYLPCVGIYALGRGLLPALFPFAGVLNVVILTVAHFVIGFVFVKIFTALTVNLNDYRAIIAVGAVIEFVISIGLAIAVAAVVAEFVA